MIAAAQRLFVAKGYTDTTMADIARTAGVALQSAYRAGSSKAELLQLVVDDTIAQISTASFTVGLRGHSSSSL